MLGTPSQENIGVINQRRENVFGAEVRLSLVYNMQDFSGCLDI